MRLDVTEGSGSEAPTRGTLRPPVVVVVLCVPYRTVQYTAQKPFLVRRGNWISGRFTGESPQGCSRTTEGRKD